VLYFTSDLHLGHANVIRLASRPFECIEEMNERLIANINEIPIKLAEEDELGSLTADS